MNALTHGMEQGGGREATATSPHGPARPARASFYGLLGSLFRDEATVEVITALRSPPLREALIDAGMVLGDDFFTEDPKALGEDLAVAFSTLFLVPGTLISPHESVQMPGGSAMLRGPETAAVETYYEALGFAIDTVTPMEPDHISIELEFLGHLCEHEDNSRMAEDRAGVRDALHFQDDFLNRHLERWVFDFLDKVERRAAHRFYDELARLTCAFLKDERARISEQLKAPVE
ncbi:TorD/DmsD family molecular chaperone [Varunaivibrio sulfuroxidans]|uniref:TorA maturation chaperone TorD n=1 Tax=Varunaivibrio sulfuroxidans TaxID=1773489 RepID=A0A4R3J7U3_9PROT|nr:molecular chaperone TorD family protein [Varunaivibrio sulfuroxidans]TCS60560.1 TorA maturation chaperone TorD [Varunaivibrio sulfuroxidans]WES30050.1 molecular chaperone TorD family protein [Varunaivibrio sulfuroxidans]